MTEANEISRLRDENQNLQQIVADGPTGPPAAPSTGDVAPEGCAVVAVLLANEGACSGLLEHDIENEIDDDALAPCRRGPRRGECAGRRGAAHA